MKLHYTKYTANYKEFILGCLDVEDTMKEEERINYIWDRFRQEYGHMIDRVGEQKALSEWLSGLALPLPFYNYDIIELAKRVETELLKINKPLKVAVMGCVVNGPGEAKDADIGIACGKSKAILFKKGKKIKILEEKELLTVLMAEVERL